MGYIKRRINLKKAGQEIKNQIKEIREGITKKDLFLFLIFPLIITVLMFLPETIMQILRLNIKEPSWWQYITKIFIHTNWTHYKSNLFAYIFYAFPILLIANLGKVKKEFYNLFLFVIITLPLFSSFIQVIFYPIILNWLPNLKYSSGSSGLVSALAGFLPLFWIVYIKKRVKRLNLKIDFMLIFMAYSALVFAFIYSKKMALILVLVLILTLLIWINRKVLKISFKEIGKESRNNFLLSYIMVITPILFLITPPIIFPSVKTLFGSGSFTDIGMHYVGIVYGLAISGIYFLVMKKNIRKS